MTKALNRAEKKKKREREWLARIKLIPFHNNEIFRN